MDVLEALDAGPELAATLAQVDRTGLTSAELPVLVAARQRQCSHEQAQLLVDLVGMARGAVAPFGRQARVTEEELERVAVQEIALTLHCGERYARDLLDLGRDLISRLPDVLAAFLAGRIDQPKAAAFVEILACLPVEMAQRIAARLLPHAQQQTLALLRTALRRAVDRADPGAARRRYQRRVTQRRFWLCAGADGTASMGGSDLPAHRAAAGFDRVDRLARAARAAGDSRNLNQLRADVFLDLLQGLPFTVRPSSDPAVAEADARRDEDPDSSVGVLAGDRCGECGGLLPAERAGVVDVQLLLTTMAGLDDTPGMIVGLGSCPADVARQAAVDPVARPTWRFSVFDAEGALSYHGIVNSRPRCRSRNDSDGTRCPSPNDTLCRCKRLRPGERRGTVELQVDEATLATLTANPPPGFASVVTDIARQVAQDRRSDQVSEVGGATGRHPDAVESAFIRARDRTCRFPTCPRPATRCELDHIVEHANGGASHRRNCRCLCKLHHVLRHLPGVTVTTEDGVTVWRMPNGRCYRTKPDKDIVLAREALET